jgi:hypothetical protein
MRSSQRYSRNTAALRMPLPDAIETLDETLPDIEVPATWMHGGRSRFVNIYAPEIERIHLPATSIGPHPVRLQCAIGDTWTHLQQHRSRVGRPSGPRTLWRYWSERIGAGRVLDLGNRLTYDTRWVFNGNLAHVLQHHVATLGFIRARTGAGPGDILVVLESHAPPIARRLLNLVGYETIETHRAVRAPLLTLQQRKDVPYHLLPFAAMLQPTVLPTTTVDRVFIPRRGSRRLVNEAEIREVTEARGYTTIYMEDLPLTEQIAVMRRASSVIAVHGAALGHFALRCLAQGDAPIDLVEILSPALVTDIFRKYVAAQGGRWRGCRGTLTSRVFRTVAESSDYKRAANEDFHLDPQALEASLAPG